MKKHIILSLLLASCFSVFAQDAIEILRNSKAKCLSVTNGYYEMTSYFKAMSDTDTMATSFTCHFKKLENDTCFPSAFHFKAYYQGDYRIDYLYTGEDLAIYYKNDSSGQLISRSKWPDVVKSHNQQNTIYYPLTSKEAFPLPVESDYLDTTHFFSLIGEELINKQSCYHIRINDTPINEPDDPWKAHRIEFNYWIGKADSVPVMYSLAFDMTMEGDSIYQYEKYILTKYSLNDLQDETPLTLSSIPPYVKLTEYVP
jgi:hypothetical protein